MNHDDHENREGCDRREHQKVASGPASRLHRYAAAARTIGRNTVTTRLAVIAAAVLIAWGMKHHYSVADVEDLTWILRPTTGLVSAVTGERFTWQAGEGYVSRNRLFVIEKSCAGINFMIAAFGMLVIALAHRARPGAAAIGVLGGSLLAGYSAAVLINAVRIAIAMWLAAYAGSFHALTAADTHRLEGIIVYFGGLMLLHEVARQFDRHVPAPGRTS
jgi:exosortase K